MAIESPKYELIEKDKQIEIRQYLGYINATVNVESESHNSAGSQGFSYLANYIFGGNKEGQKISMTAPVSTLKKNRNQYVISFTMPSKYTKASLPTPNDDNVTIKQVDKYKAVVIRFTGFTTESKLEKKINELKIWAKNHKLELLSEPIISRFNPPWIPGFLRHNEISIKIR
jgi:hypothetical protein